eukprot:371096-Pleurochrysis_carterae.AAC.1
MPPDAAAPMQLAITQLIGASDTTSTGRATRVKPTQPTMALARNDSCDRPERSQPKFKSDMLACPRALACLLSCSLYRPSSPSNAAPPPATPFKANFLRPTRQCL